MLACGLVAAAVTGGRARCSSVAALSVRVVASVGGRAALSKRAGHWWGGNTGGWGQPVPEANDGKSDCDSKGERDTTVKSRVEVREAYACANEWKSEDTIKVRQSERVYRNARRKHRSSPVKSGDKTSSSPFGARDIILYRREERRVQRRAHHDSRRSRGRLRGLRLNPSPPRSRLSKLS